MDDLDQLVGYIDIYIYTSAIFFVGLCMSYYKVQGGELMSYNI